MPPLTGRLPKKTSLQKMAAVTQQQAMLNAVDPPSTEHPRTRFRLDLPKFIQHLQYDGEDIVLMG
jgi:hypothetical protein